MLDRFIGNENVKTIARRMLRRGSLPHSILFTGIDAIGKKEFAFELAKAFACPSPRESEACGECPVCRRASQFDLPKPTDKDANEQILFSGFPDIGLIRPAGKFITVKQIRDLEREANYRPYEGRARFFVIDEADRMNDSASNALLKTLEEPPSTSYIFLISSRPDALLPTIRSRCQTIRFAPPNSSDIEEYLRREKGVSPIDAAILAGISHGSIGRALSTDLELLREEREAMMRVLDAIIFSNDRATLLRTAEEITDAKNKDNYENYLEILQTLIHDVWTLGLGGEKIVNSDIRQRLEELAASSDTRRLASWLREIETMRENFNVNLNKKIATDALFMQMAG